MIRQFIFVMESAGICDNITECQIRLSNMNFFLLIFFFHRINWLSNPIFFLQVRNENERREMFVSEKCS